MSNSSLATYVAISPNSSVRVKKIRKITVHHMAAKLSVETCGAVFATSSRQASSNYGIGFDGRVGLYVDESRQAWTSSSYSNDQEAVTIEVSNSSLGGDWPVSDVCWNRLVELCVDICKRNDIKELIWTGDSNGTLTCHYMFAPTACPGGYLNEHMAKLANEVNSRLNYSYKEDDDVVEISIPKGGADVYRLYNPRTGQHMWTTSRVERDNLLKDEWNDEGIGWHSPDTGMIVYRLYNPSNGDHLFTTYYKEASAVKRSGWTYEGANFASGRDGTPVYRMFDPVNGQHMWTINKKERDDLIAHGWNDEGVGFYAA